MKRCHVLLLNWNGWQDTIECLESLFRLDYPDFRVVVCDNGSTDGSLEKIRAWSEDNLPGGNDFSKIPFTSKSISVKKPIPYRQYTRHQIEEEQFKRGDERLVLIDNQANLGFAGGNNVGLKYLASFADWDYVWLLNNDTVVEPDSLTQLVNRAKDNRKIGICGSTLLYYHDPEKIQAQAGGYYCKWIGLPWLLGRFSKFDRKKVMENVLKVESRINYVMGASMLVTREFIGQVGFMNEGYFLYFEETDWAWRGKNSFRLGYAPLSIVYHKGGNSIGTSSNPFKKSLICDYFALRNRLLFSRWHCRETLPAIYLSLFGAMIIRLCCGRWRNAAVIRDVICGRDHHWRDLINGQGPLQIKGESASG